jgi:glycine/serine hydroxymethyltransferase
VTTRGFEVDDCRLVAGFIADILEAPDDEERRTKIASTVREMMQSFPLPGASHPA